MRMLRRARTLGLHDRWTRLQPAIPDGLTVAVLNPPFPSKHGRILRVGYSLHGYVPRPLCAAIGKNGGMARPLE